VSIREELQPEAASESRLQGNGGEFKLKPQEAHASFLAPIVRSIEEALTKIEEARTTKERIQDKRTPSVTEQTIPRARFDLD